MLVTCSICGSQFEIYCEGTEIKKLPEMLDHEATHTSQGEIVEWIA